MSRAFLTGVVAAAPLLGLAYETRLSLLQEGPEIVLLSASAALGLLTIAFLAWTFPAPGRQRAGTKPSRTPLPYRLITPDADLVRGLLVRRTSGCRVI